MKSFFKLLGFIIVVLIIQSFFANLYKGFKGSAIGCKEYAVKDSLTDNPSIKHQRFWKDNNHSAKFCMSYAYQESKFNKSNSFRNVIKTPYADSYDQYWGKIYHSLYINDSSSLVNIRDSLMSIKTNKQLNSTEFAHMVVKFVQDIPYSYIMSESCDQIKDGKPCKGDSRFGILSPIEFLYTLYGDCDTRTVLLYGILKDLGYEPLILISKEYLHSMLALNISSYGDHILHKGKKFYFWETTNTGWEPGMIAPDMKNIAYWDIALD